MVKLVNARSPSSHMKFELWLCTARWRHHSMLKKKTIKFASIARQERRRHDESILVKFGIGLLSQAEFVRDPSSEVQVPQSSKFGLIRGFSSRRVTDSVFLSRCTLAWKSTSWIHSLVLNLVRSVKGRIGKRAQNFQNLVKIRGISGVYRLAGRQYISIKMKFGTERKNATKHGVGVRTPKRKTGNVGGRPAGLAATRRRLRFIVNSY